MAVTPHDALRVLGSILPGAEVVEDHLAAPFFRRALDRGPDRPTLLRAGHHLVGIAHGEQGSLELTWRSNIMAVYDNALDRDALDRCTARSMNDLVGWASLVRKSILDLSIEGLADILDPADALPQNGYRRAYQISLALKGLGGVHDLVKQVAKAITFPWRLSQKNPDTQLCIIKAAGKGLIAFRPNDDGTASFTLKVPMPEGAELTYTVKRDPISPNWRIRYEQVYVHLLLQWFQRLDPHFLRKVHLDHAPDFGLKG